MEASHVGGFEARVRETTTGQGTVPGLCVLDVTPSNIYSFAQGRILNVEKDLFAALPSDRAEEALAACIDAGLPMAFALRCELCNYKKVYLNLFQRTKTLEKDLRRLCSFFFSEVVEFRSLDPSQLTVAALAAVELQGEGCVGFRHAARYTELCKAMQRAKGVLNAVLDVRNVSKAACCLPRHPDAELPGGERVAAVAPRSLRELPHGLLTAKSLANALRLVADYGGGATTDAELRWEVATDSGGGRLLYEKIVTTLRDGSWAGLDGADEWLAFVRSVLIARGAAKALWIAHEIRQWAELSAVIPSVLACAVNELRKLPKCAPESLRVPVLVDKHVHCLESSAAVMREDATWMRMMIERAEQAAKANSGSDGNTPLFVAGDGVLSGQNAMWLPPSFAAEALGLLEECKRVAERYKREMDAELDSGTRQWPPPCSGGGEGERGSESCVSCGHRFTNLWIFRGVCCRCEGVARREGRCPFRQTKCDAKWWCPHARRCFVCDLWSCDEPGCRMSRADGDDTVSLVERLKPLAVFLDFDRTLCSTRNGGNPLHGRGAGRAGHSLDVGLRSLCIEHDNVHVVTRNSHRDEIVRFLREEKCPIRDVHSVPQRIGTKAGVIAAICAEAAEKAGLAPGVPVPAVFVDDDIKEHAKLSLDSRILLGNEEIESDARLVRMHRVLFTRVK